MFPLKHFYLHNIKIKSNFKINFNKIIDFLFYPSTLISVKRVFFFIKSKEIKRNRISNISIELRMEAPKKSPIVPVYFQMRQSLFFGNNNLM